MDATYHGTERIFGRTEMRHDDVLLIIAQRVTVELGSWNGFRYYLFYSPPNKDCKIAVTSADHTLLISVWEKHYRLPEGVTKVEWSLEQKAKALLASFLVTRMKELSLQKGPRQLTVTVDVFVRHHVVYTHTCEKIFLDNITKKSLMTALMPDLRYLATAVEEHKTKADTHIRYGIRAKNPETQTLIWPYFTIGHQQIIRTVPYAA